MEPPIQNRVIKCLNAGYVQLCDWMGNDRTPAKCARTSFRNPGERTEAEDDKLTRYLITHAHNTPVEFVQLRFYIKAPIFVARQFMRHRTQSINEVSYRYVEARDEFYVPELWRLNKRATNNKQGSSEELVEKPSHVAGLLTLAYETAYEKYGELLDAGLAPELARVVLPVGAYTEWYTQMNMHNFLHMIKLRTDKHAQHEIKIYANAMLRLARAQFPGIVTAWQETQPK